MSKKILVIESDGPFAREVSSVIEARGLEARVTGDGKEGFELARADRPDAILLCVELPRMSGYSICNRLKKDPELRSIPLVIMSAEATPETFEQHRKLKTRAEDYLIKPFAPAELFRKLGGLIELPAEVEAEEVVTIDDVEELETLQEAAPSAEEDDDLKLLDDAFESLAADVPSPAAAHPPEAPAPEAAGEVLELEPASADEEALDLEVAGTASDEIDQLGADADAALAALGADEPEEIDLASATALLDEEDPSAPGPAAPPPPAAPFVAAVPLVPAPPFAAAAPPAPSAPVMPSAPQAPAMAQAAVEPARPSADPGAGLAAVLAAAAAEHTAEVQRLQDRVSELLIELARAREAVEQREVELGAAGERARQLETALEGQRVETRQAEERARRAGEEAEERVRGAVQEHAVALRAATLAAEEALAATRAEGQAHQERGTALAAQLAEAVERHGGEARTRAEAEAALAETRAALAEAKERLEAAEERVRGAEEVTRAAETRCSAAEAENAELTLKLEEAAQAASLRAAESEQSRERAEAVARELTETRGRAEAHEADLADHRTRLATAQGETASAREEAERLATELRRRITELEAQVAKHEERVVKAYQKIKGDEKIREKTRKALAIALQLLEERAPGAAPPEVQPRRE